MKAPRNLLDGMFISSDNIPNKATFSQLTNAAVNQGISCSWKWEDWTRVQGADNKKVRLVVRQISNSTSASLDVEGSVFPNRTEVTIEQWCDTTRHVRSDDETPKMIVTIRLDKTSQPIVHEAKNAYQKGDMYCVYLMTGKVKKYPLVNLFEVEEDYKPC